MAGHSKWKNIQRTKGAADAKRGKVFTKIAREIIVAVKEGSSGDPAKNSRLAAAIAKAKAANMPNDNIKRTIERAVGSGNADNYERVTYEGYGPRGVAVLVDAMTDNRNRIAAEVRLNFDKYGGNLGTSGCVSWSFDRKGVIVVDNENGEHDEESVLNDALEAGADDVEIDEDVFEIYTSPDGFASVSGTLENVGYNILSAQIEMVPQNYVTLTDATDIKNMTKMLELMEDNDDIQDVWHNALF
ncbi:MAG: YebC/PmpR family DNA-binding transcriptional regulator [Oscillospiraceae bacterium]|jgi:YebC/PmpR family DNA-binding regulatory protein|nr:YebC/PmpR family DNA-binding transcriptional regulator [Oscillospiraceae bacterium]